MDIRKAFSKILRELLIITACLSQQQTQATYIQKEEIRKSIYLSYVEGTSEKLILKSHILYTESTLRKLLIVNSFMTEAVII